MTLTTSANVEASNVTSTAPAGVSIKPRGQRQPVSPLKPISFTKKTVRPRPVITKKVNTPFSKGLMIRTPAQKKPVTVQPRNGTALPSKNSSKLINPAVIKAMNKVTQKKKEVHAITKKLATPKNPATLIPSRKP